MHLVVTGVPEPNLETLARALRRVVLGTLIDQHADLDETREQLRTLIETYTIGEQREKHTES